MAVFKREVRKCINKLADNVTNFSAYTKFNIHITSNISRKQTHKRCLTQLLRKVLLCYNTSRWNNASGGGT